MHEYEFRHNLTQFDKYSGIVTLRVFSCIFHMRNDQTVCFSVDLQSQYECRQYMPSVIFPSE